MESTGIPGKIQISESTAEILKTSKHNFQISSREELTDVKGKGLLQTYWLDHQMVSTPSPVIYTETCENIAIELKYV